MNKKNIFRIQLLSLFLLASCTNPTTTSTIESSIPSSANPSVNPDTTQSPGTQPSSSVNPSANISPTPSATGSSGNINTALSIPSDFLKLSYNDYYSAELKWTQITGAKSYKIYQDGKIIADNLTDNIYSVKNLTPNTDYTFDIVAVNGIGESNKSSLRLRTFIPSNSSSSNNNNYVYSPENTNNPYIASTSLTRGFYDDEILINGFNFNPDISGNIVRFGSTIATVISASNNQLKVKIPSGISGS